MVLLYMILGAIARRIYGGACENIPILKNRGVQTAFMMLLFLSIYFPYKWYITLVIVCWLQFQFWSRGHGCAFDLGFGGYPTPEIIKRYNERWYHIPCDWLAEKGCFSYYATTYDFCYMTLRYTCPMIPMMYFDWRYILIGLSISFIYLFFWSFGFKKPTEWAEIVSGAVVYSGCYLLC